VFDSRFSLDDFHPSSRYQYLRMQIRGWEIETDWPSFDPRIATFLDFRTSQVPKGPDLARQSPSPAMRRRDTGGLRFLYVLPFDARRALVEHVACIPAGAKLMDETEEEGALRGYIEGTLRIPSYRVVRCEEGVNPMTDYPFPRRKSTGSHVMAIGIPGGMLKGSTGFAFARIQRDSAAITRSLAEQGTPWVGTCDAPPAGRIYRASESLMLWAMAHQGRKAGSLLGTLFRVGSTPKILGFLDEEGLPL
jgi:lycopene beta-cyclase